MPVGPASLPVPLSVSLTLPPERRFISLGVAMTKLIAEQLGYPGQSAAKLAAEFEEKVGAALSQAAPIAVQYEGSQSGLAVKIRAGNQTIELAPL
jgi:hypothetical protein